MAAKLKSKRGFIEPQKFSNSNYKLDVEEWCGVSLTLGDCNRTITWEFGKPTDKDKRGKKKIATIKKLIDEIYGHFHDEA